MTTIIIGTGPAGLICAGSIKSGKIIVLDKNEKVGKKIYITGKGRCNVTNDCDDTKFLNNIVTNSKFMFGTIKKFSTLDAMQFFEDNGVKLKVERGGRVFPVSDKASDITGVLKKTAEKNGAEIVLNAEVSHIVHNDNKFKVSLTSGKTYESDNLVIATGGKSYPLTGSTGDGYKFAKVLGHNVSAIRPALVPFVLKENVSGLEGLSLKNIELSVVLGKKTYKQFGEMLFTSNGVSGPCVLSLSSYISKENISNVEISIDLKTGLDKEQLSARILRDFDKFKNKQIKNSLSELLPKSLVPYVIAYCGIDENTSVNSITKAQREALVDALKGLKFTIKHLVDVTKGIVTGGGVDTKEISPKDMQSKLIKGLYFVGEVLDIDALTGGFNIQVALSTGYLAGSSIGE